jgi:hypothetical protein
MAKSKDLRDLGEEEDAKIKAENEAKASFLMLSLCWILLPDSPLFLP